MTLKNFLGLHEGGVCCHISIEDRRKKYCEEEEKENIVQSEWFHQLAEREVIRFCVIGGGMYNVELCIELADNR